MFPTSTWVLGAQTAWEQTVLCANHSNPTAAQSLSKPQWIEPFLACPVPFVSDGVLQTLEFTAQWQLPVDKSQFHLQTLLTCERNPLSQDLGWPETKSPSRMWPCWDIINTKIQYSQKHWNKAYTGIASRELYKASGHTMQVCSLPSAGQVYTITPGLGCIFQFQEADFVT